jgi:1-acyl-sn-glycerol-3-phosphate acyltransferase
MSILYHLKGAITLLLIYSYTLVMGTLLVFTALIQYLLPIHAWRKIFKFIATRIAEFWVEINNVVYHFILGVRWEVDVEGELNYNDSYIVISNHQSWVDIVTLNKVFNFKIPFLRYFIKQELFWVPILGLTWKALDFPFMKRYSKEFLKKHPHLKGKDIEETRKACEKYKDIPVSIMNFVEGTRFSQEKHDEQQSPYSHLLTPKAGGIALALESMSGVLKKLVDVTIYYPEGSMSFWDFLCGKVTRVVVKIKVLSLPDSLFGNYLDNSQFAESFKIWLNNYWHDKDVLLTQLNSESNN